MGILPEGSYAPPTVDPRCRCYTEIALVRNVRR